MRRLASIAIGVHVALALVGCGPSEQQKAEKRRIECLDKMCQGDIVPKHDTMNEEVLKLNGKWFIGPKEYFSSGFNGAAFEWWDHKPLSSLMKRPEEAQALAVAGKGYDISVEIFLRSHDGVMHGPPRFEALKLAESQGRVLGKKEIKPDLEAWRVEDEVKGLPPAIWYVAKNLKDANGEPPVLGCDDQDPKFDRCTMAFIWQPGIAADLRFRAKHGSDWPEIYQEVIRVLQLIRKV